MRNNYLKGALAGTIATFFHTAVMFALHPRLPKARRLPLPPVEVTSISAARLGAETAQTGSGLVVATTVAHFAYGAVTGALYPPLAARVHKGRVLAGAGFGVGVWAVSYLGWVPALRILPPARQPGQRNLMMILAHVAWGAALTVAFDRLNRSGRKTNQI